MTKIIKVRNNMLIMVEDNGEKVLVSYTTNVAKIAPNGEFIKLWNGYSATTMRHINDFRAMYGLPKMNKSAWVLM